MFKGLSGWQHLGKWTERPSPYPVKALPLLSTHRRSQQAHSYLELLLVLCSNHCWYQGVLVLSLLLLIGIDTLPLHPLLSILCHFLCSYQVACIWWSDVPTRVLNALCHIHAQMLCVVSHSHRLMDVVDCCISRTPL
jgi:hypothetical protein